MNNPRLYRYTDEELAEIRRRIDARDPAWLDAVWTPILLDAHGVTLEVATAQGLEVDVTGYGIPWGQSTTIAGWLANLRGGFRVAWFSYGPSPVREDAAGAAGLTSEGRSARAREAR